MNEEISKFVLGRLNLHGKSEPGELQDAYLKFKSCMDNLRTTLSMVTPTVSMLYSKTAVTNSLMDKIAHKCKIQQKQNTTKADSLLQRLDLIKNWR